MEFFLLNSARKPSTTFSDFETLIWSERYRDPGDFKLIVDKKIPVKDLFPRGSLVSHTDTKEVMIVEDHEINRDDSRKLTITVSGRSFETFAENRVSYGSELPLKDALGNDNVVTTASMPSAELVVNLLRVGLAPGYASADDAIPNLAVSMDMRVLDPAMTHVLKRGQLYPVVLDYLKMNDAGMKIVRPEGVDTTMDIVVHDGADRRATVIFYALYEDIENETYFWSSREDKNYAQIAADTTARLYRDRNEPVALTGLDRKVLYVDAGDIQGNFTPGSSSDVIAARGQTELDSKNEIAILTCRVTRTARPKFKLHYDVGDLVTVRAEFGIAQTMRVTEHILTVDENGAIGYPSLSAI